MNRDEAFKALLDGKKVTHKYFTKSEYLYMVGGVITGEDGVNLHSHFFNTDFMSDGFHIYNGDNNEQIS
ncbi:hypothetical protein [Morganella morganii]|uniref:hypothetical protein n=1 Tax=Morganella morganii TaxID=582 RepID=UPI0031B5C9CA|nr:hypothetical protein [Morganella morganii]